KLASDPDVKGGALDVKVSQGVVTLAGSVETTKQRTKAEKLTRKVKGVKDVVNQITIKQVPDR
ncbi:MAG: BON domain-containing protein, partial [Acidobacteriota bacterium]|nr:BON domain-containing protein [Acidobacteriota bacterium]